MILWELSERLRLRQILTRLYRAEVCGAEHVPATGPCIFVANHESLIDPWFLCLATPRRVRFMAKAELWRYAGIRWAMEAYGTFPVERGNGDTGAMTRAGELLADGEALGMFPRGTSKPTGNHIWHRGAARLALRTESHSSRYGWSPRASSPRAIRSAYSLETRSRSRPNGRQSPPQSS